MGTKNNPGKFDCHAAADPDEPMFVLLGRDRMGCVLVRVWADMREAAGETPEKVAEARACADAMEAWLQKLGKHPYGEVETSVALRSASDALIDSVLSKRVCDRCGVHIGKRAIARPSGSLDSGFCSKCWGEVYLPQILKE